jgi:hypothetical protein
MLLRAKEIIVVRVRSMSQVTAPNSNTVREPRGHGGRWRVTLVTLFSRVGVECGMVIRCQEPSSIQLISSMWGEG